MTDVSSLPCPVPLEQQPLHEYQALKEGVCFRHTALSSARYLIAIAVVWSLGWFVAGPVAASSFPILKSPTKFFISGTAGTSFLLLLVLVRLYLGWVYIRNRLFNATIAYEESGWYDGQSWTKPEAILARDRLVVTYQIQPVLNRLKLTLGILSGILLGGVIVWQWL